ncbi:hypothetical protein HMPREF1020_04006 [Clostridium sp. 7_3_54FAA]|nr:hypothetical protein HMPREF1020_04006 [Clostridium sp. 7_3_54FAA]
MGVRRCLARFLTSLALRCALQRVQTVPAAIHSGRIPPPQPTSHGDGRLSHLPHHTGHGPFRTRPPTSVKSPFRSRNNRTAQTIIYRKYVVAATRFPSPLRLETISARNGPCPVPRKPLPESSVPGETLPGEVGGINCGGDMGVRRCLARFLTSLALRCALQRVQTVPAVIHSGRIPPPRPTSHGDGRLREPPHHTGHGPFRTRPPNLS